MLYANAKYSGKRSILSQIPNFLCQTKDQSPMLGSIFLVGSGMVLSYQFFVEHDSRKHELHFKEGYTLPIFCSQLSNY